MKKILVVCFIFLANMAWAGDYEEGFAALGSKNYSVAIEKFQKAANQGNVDAQSALGFMYNEGAGVSQNYTKAIKWYKMAAKQGNLFAQFTVGYMYLEGQGVVQNYVKAHMWFNLAAVNANINAKNLRDLVAKEMTPQQIAQAQQMASACQASNYKNCD
jgi:hypothetical protein